MATTVFLDFDIRGGGDEVRKMLDHLDACFSVVGMTGFMQKDIVPFLRERAKARFGSEGDAASGKWAPLMPVTREIRQHGISTGAFPGISPSHPINRRTGDLEEFITQGVGTIRSTGAASQLDYPQRTVPARKGLNQKVRRAQAGDSRTVKRPVLAVNQTDLTFVMTALAFFIKREGNQ